MKKEFQLFLTVLFLFFSTTAFPQIMQKKAPAGENMKKPHRIDARPILDRIDAKIRMETGSAQLMQKDISGVDKTAWSFAVGSVKSWYALDLTTEDFYTVSSTCRAVGTNCYIFVENSLWTAGTVTQAAVNSVQEAFDSKTPANASKGIYQTDVETFGAPPDVDGDSKIIILILDIRDGYDGGGYVAGYFHGHNETNLASSNKAEIFYLDANPLNLTEASGIQEGMSTTAHEFQHMIHYNYHQFQETFFNEGCSMVAEYLCGYGAREQGSYSKETNHYLLDWRSDDAVLTDYSRAFRFMFYYYDQFGLDVLKNFVQSSQTGIAGINDALSKDVPATTIRFNDLFENWLVANIVNNKNVNPLYGYSYNGLNVASGLAHFNPNVSSNIVLAKLGAQYLHFVSGENLSINFSSTGAADLKIYAIQSGPSNYDIYEVPFGTGYNVPDFGSKYTRIDFVIMNKNQSNNISFSYTATGASQESVVELKYDESEPVGFLDSPTGDSVAVIFDAVPGGKIDSVKIAVRKTGAITGGIFKLASSGNSPLGAKIASIEGSSSLNPSKPYPVPWPNWVTSNVSNLNLSSDEPFGVSVGYTSASSNRVMVTYYPGTDFHYNYAYSSADNQWLYYVADSDQDGTSESVWLYLIRAYVSVGGIGTEKETIELAPSKYNLAQNYPNPFNPSTTIKFSIPQGNDVVIEIYNMTGQKIKTLVKDYYAAGTYEAAWNGLNENGMKVSSGIYLYRIKAGNYIKTNKMTLLK
jgi:hypothetical protein